MASKEHRTAKPANHPAGKVHNSNSPMEQPQGLAEEVGLKLVLWSTQALFENRNTLPEKTFEKVMGSAKKILESTRKNASVR